MLNVGGPNVSFSFNFNYFDFLLHFTTDYLLSGVGSSHCMRLELNSPNQTISHLLLNHNRQALLTKQGAAEGGVEGNVDMRLGRSDMSVAGGLWSVRLSALLNIRHNLSSTAS